MTSTHVAEPILSVNGLTGRFDGADAPTLIDVSFDILPGRITAIVGETGSGKSLTTLTALGLNPKNFVVETGEVIFGGRDLLRMGERELRAIRGGRIATVFQDARTALNPVFTVGRQLADACRLHHGVNKWEARDIAIQTLERVRIPDAARRFGQYPHEFSGGMAQRVMIALALVCEPELVLLDEPTTGLDVTIQAGIMELILDLAEQGMTACLITHDLGVVAETCEDAIVMRAGRVIERASVEELFTAPRHEYTQQLIAASRQMHEVIS